MHKAQGLFITGTDTGVGKTRVAATLIVALKSRGLRVGVMKPAETGCLIKEGRLHAQDSHFLRQISGSTAPQKLITPYVLREPLAPAFAAQYEGQAIDLDHIVRCYNELASEHDVLLVEGAGGLLVPLTEQKSFLDLAILLNLPLLVVARNSLGTINHTALTVMVASQYCRVSGIILNNPSEVEDASRASNAMALRLWGRAPLLGELPYMQDCDPESLLRQSESIYMSALLSTLSTSMNHEG